MRLAFKILLGGYNTIVSIITSDKETYVNLTPQPLGLSGRSPSVSIRVPVTRDTRNMATYILSMGGGPLEGQCADSFLKAADAALQQAKIWVALSHSMQKSPEIALRELITAATEHDWDHALIVAAMLPNPLESVNSCVFSEMPLRKHAVKSTSILSSVMRSDCFGIQKETMIRMLTKRQGQDQSKLLPDVKTQVDVLDILLSKHVNELGMDSEQLKLAALLLLERDEFKGFTRDGLDNLKQRVQELMSDRPDLTSMQDEADSYSVTNHTTVHPTTEEIVILSVDSLGYVVSAELQTGESIALNDELKSHFQREFDKIKK